MQMRMGCPAKEEYLPSNTGSFSMEKNGVRSLPEGCFKKEDIQDIFWAPMQCFRKFAKMLQYKQHQLAISST